SAATERAGLTVKPSPWAVPVMRLVNIRSSDNSSPMGALGSVCAGMISPSTNVSDGFRPAFAGANAEAVLQRQDEDLAIADAPLGSSAARLHDGVDRRLDEILVHGDLQLHLPPQVDRQLVAAVDLRVPLLSAEALHID